MSEGVDGSIIKRLLKKSFCRHCERNEAISQLNKSIS